VNSPTTPRRNSKGHFLPAHNHLDQQVRPRGECRGCDLIWAVQRQRLAKVSSSAAAQMDIDIERAAARRARAKTARPVVVIDERTDEIEEL
jgi:hypothetical protein